MIIESEIRLYFPEGASFSEAPSLILYRKILTGIKRISCINCDSKCNHCPNQSDCRYFWITGNNFETLPGISCQNQLFEKKLFQKNEECKIRIYWIGEAGTFSVLTEQIIEQLNQKLNGQLFLYNCKNKLYEQHLIQVRSLNILTPIAGSSNLSERNLFQLAAEEFDIRYQAKCQYPDSDYRWRRQIGVRLDPIQLPTRKISRSGNIGLIDFGDEVLLDSLFLQIGLGLTSFIGGGKIEINNNI